MMEETETEKTIGFFVTFLWVITFQLGGGGRALPFWLRLCLQPYSQTTMLLSYFCDFCKKQVICWRSEFDNNAIKMKQNLVKYKIALLTEKKIEIAVQLIRNKF